ncbi:Planctomycete cytochrome C [Posidoniimonas polymericola]|uniref:Planctomycete cytochrome C n=1 Tax=Posidoniimonas polymericola TaxID=2528002 RepID=A0A5C5YRS1_9BACT|nr:DUF1553 domain-containing protein [Posidoniimonas polymericola]TWT77606.1 Planctomycete cytochrome C [Posidoniimonas polymericola]
MHRPAFITLALTLHLACSAACCAEVTFNRDVRPILSDKCYFCHGPDERSRQADLRLDIAEQARDAIESGALVERICTTDDSLVMPPVDSKLSLTAAEKQTLRNWLDAGARYERHWAFTPLPDRVPPPRTSDPSWPRSPLDRFVLARLDEEGLKPSPAAEPLRWLRRVTLDLTGLPPTPDEINAFKQAAKSDPEAAMRDAVDRLLASDAFGERLAVGWLDSARYADSYGYQADQLNTLWPYRDWVIRAFNDNLPYDQFLTWQMAGDLLPGPDNQGPTRDQRLATAFNRLHRLNGEGGAVFEEWRIENVADRVHTVGTAVMGLTLECSRCHDHKYDPITMRDYYALGAFFNSIDENGLYDRTAKVPAPSMLLPNEEQEHELHAARQQVAGAEERYAEARTTADDRYRQWLAALESGEQAARSVDLVADVRFDRPFDETQKDVWRPSTDDRAETADLPRVDVTDSPLQAPADLAAPRRALRLDGDHGATILGIPPVDRWTPFSLMLTFRETKRTPERAILAHYCRGTDAGFNGWDLTIEDGFVASRMYRDWPGNAIGVRTVEPIPADQWHSLAAVYDGSSAATGLRLYLGGKPLETQIVRDRIYKQAGLPQGPGGDLVIGQRFRSRGLAGGLIEQVRFYSRAIAPGEARSFADSEPLPRSLAYYASAVDAECREAARELAAARERLVMAEETVHEVPIMAELPTPRAAHVLARGQYDSPTDASTLVGRSTFAAEFPPFPAAAPRNRLGLAQWLTAPDHPLTSRVFVNRLWANFFGRGLVATPDNFGLQGAQPTHPELLDWLARDFVAHGWDVKRLCREIMLSSTYRQASAVTPALLEADPDNLLLARGPAHRLDAEQIRDLALAASGLLNDEVGGPPVSPYQPGEDLWREANIMSPHYQQSVGESLYRRSVYSVWKRTAPLPNMLAFDTPTREVCTVGRSRTNTPLQALVLLNDVQFVEAARALAADVLDEGLDNSEAIRRAFVRFAGREATDPEQRILEQLLADEQTYYREHPEAARELIGAGSSEVDASLDESRLAALTTVCQAILNLDATVWKR